MNKIKEVMEQKEIKQTWLVEKFGKTYNMVNGYSQNRQHPRLVTLMDIAEILDIDVKDLRVLNKPEQENK
jgi:putative transcriptional regulator